VGSKDVTLTTADGLRLDARWHQGGDRVVVLAHGLTVDLEENGLFEPLAAALVARGLSVLRFSYRGHGGSDGIDTATTVAGERMDLRAAIDWVGRPVALLGSSFGAVSVSLSLAELGDAVRAVVLWQPVLDLNRTFLEPDLPRGRELYRGWAHGPIDIEGRFRLGAALYAELDTIDPRAAFLASPQPALVVHGDADSLVSHEIARDTAQRRPATGWHSVRGAGHGFLEPAAGAEVVHVTAEWLAANG
jgi:pimeloyl-ACP methyl ester carboxylesterase